MRAVEATRKKRRGGRPVKPADQQAAVRLTCNTTQAKARKIREAAHAVRRTTSAFLAETALGATDKLRNVPGINLVAVRELRRQGTNLNQLTAAFNAGKNPPETERILREVHALYGRLINQLKGGV